jgi:hypothetical protein
MSIPIVGIGASAGVGPREPTFSFVLGAWRTIVGYEAIHMIRKGHAGWSAKVDPLHRFILGLFAATN